MQGCCRQAVHRGQPGCSNPPWYRTAGSDCHTCMVSLSLMHAITCLLPPASTHARRLCHASRHVLLLPICHKLAAPGGMAAADQSGQVRCALLLLLPACTPCRLNSLTIGIAVGCCPLVQGPERLPGLLGDPHLPLHHLLCGAHPAPAAREPRCGAQGKSLGKSSCAHACFLPCPMPLHGWPADLARHGAASSSSAYLRCAAPAVCSFT